MAFPPMTPAPGSPSNLTPGGSPRPADALLGTTLGQFEILDEIGRGGMATVYRARQKSINRMVAIKVLPRSLLHDPSFYERFAREVDLISHLEHPHILPIYDYGESEGVPYIAMRYLAGGSMAQMLRRAVPPMQSVARPLNQIAQALDYAHQQGVIHRDLKPGNILLDENGNAYLSDFGIARVLNSSLTGSAIIGTPAYMSPEQANGFPLDARSDIYALGIVLFELVTGREPFEAETPVALLLKHINEPMPSVRAFRPGTQRAVEEVIFKATAKHPDDRYASAGEMAVAFEAALRQPVTEQLASPYEDMPTMVESIPATAPRGTPARITPPPVGATRQPVDTRGTVNAPVQASGSTLSSSAVMPVNAPPGTSNAAAQSQSGTFQTIPPVAAAPRRSRTPVIIGVAALVVVALIAVAAFAILPRTNPVVQPTLTPFANAQIASTGDYTLSVPVGWTFADESADGTLRHRWSAGDEMSVSLTVADASAITIDDAGAPFDAALTSTFIDTNTAPSGVIRRSYRVEQGDLPPGQIDLFFYPAGNRVGIVELYASDTVGDDAVVLFQQILDSLRLPAVQA